MAESRIAYYPINTQFKQSIPFKVTSTQLYLQDFRSVDLDDLTELEDASVFKLEQLPVKSFERDNDHVQMDISFYMNLNQIVISRSGYTTLDYLSDIGGINGMLMSSATVLLAFWNYNML